MTSGIDTEAIQNSTARLSGKHLGNTCVHPAGDVGIGWYGTGYNGLDVTDPRMPGLDYANNLVAASTCIWQSPGALALEHHNYLTGTPTPAGGYACSLPGIANATDEVGTLAAVQFTPTNPLEEATGATFPAWDDFAIPATSSAATGATSTGMSTAILVEAEWTWVLGQRRWLPCSAVAQVPAADWIKALATDYCQDTRDGTSFGALNHEP
jgi:hypothetical protein